MILHISKSMAVNFASLILFNRTSWSWKIENLKLSYSSANYLERTVVAYLWTWKPFEDMLNRTSGSLDDIWHLSLASAIYQWLLILL